LDANQAAVLKHLHRGFEIALKTQEARRDGEGRKTGKKDKR
jgi:hypothetical protein